MISSDEMYGSVVRKKKKKKGGIECKAAEQRDRARVTGRSRDGIQTLWCLLDIEGESTVHDGPKK